MPLATNTGQYLCDDTLGEKTVQYLLLVASIVEEIHSCGRNFYRKDPSNNYHNIVGVEERSAHSHLIIRGKIALLLSNKIHEQHLKETVQ